MQTLSLESLLSIQILDFELLKSAAQGKVDLNELARKELANRGLNIEGNWVGFNKQ